MPIRDAILSEGHVVVAAHHGLNIYSISTGESSMRIHFPASMRSLIVRSHLCSLGSEIRFPVSPTSFCFTADSQLLVGDVSGGLSLWFYFFNLDSCTFLDGI